MRSWSLVIGVVVALGLLASREAAAKDAVKQPVELLVAVSLGPDTTLDSLRAFANAVRPGAGGQLTETVVRKQLAAIAGVSSIDGLDPKAPTYLLVVDGGPALRGAALVGKVRDGKAVTALGDSSVVKDGWAVLGAKAIVQKVAPYAFATFPSKPAVASPSAIVYVPQVLVRYKTEIEAGRKAFLAQLSATQSSAQMSALMQSLVDGLYAFVADSDRFVVTLDVTRDAGAVDIAMVPKAGSRLARFVAAQQPSDYSLLAKLPATTAPMLVAGHLDGGPYRQGMLDVFGMMYGQGAATKDLIESMAAIMTASTGELAMVMQMGPGKPMAMTQLFGVANQKSVDKAIDHVLAQFKAGRTIEAMGVATTIKTNTKTNVHDGVTLKGYDVTYDYSKAPAATRASMEKMFPNGTAIPARISTFDRLALVTMGDSDPALAIDASRGKASHFTPSPVIADFLIGSRARKESFVMVMDTSAMAGLAGAGRTVIMSAGFADKTAHLRITMPASTMRAFSGQP